MAARPDHAGHGFVSLGDTVGTSRGERRPEGVTKKDRPDRVQWGFAVVGKSASALGTRPRELHHGERRGHREKQIAFSVTSVFSVVEPPFSNAPAPSAPVRVRSVAKSSSRGAMLLE